MIARLVEARRRRDPAEVLPQVVELTQIAVASGLSVSGAVDLLATVGPEMTRPQFAAMAEQHRSGRPLRVVLADGAALLGPAYRPFTMSLARAEREGSPLVALLDQLAAEADRARRLHSDVAVGRLSVAVMFPLVLCALPGVIITAIVPLIIVSLSRL